MSKNTHGAPVSVTAAVTSKAVTRNLFILPASSSFSFFLFHESRKKSRQLHSMLLAGCITFWCPCITFGQISEILDKGATSCCANCATFTLIHLLTSVAFAYPCTCFYSYPYRARLRREFELKEYPCNDCLVHCCCMSCALCQEYRELKSRGFNVEKGWAGNASQHGEVAMAPKAEGGMRR